MMEKWILRRVLDEFVKYVRNNNLEDDDDVDVERVQYYDRITDLLPAVNSSSESGIFGNQIKIQRIFQNQIKILNPI